uniref:Uncharacterized protein n=1 Tax=Rhizophora mucronata TaxID=61149 RepID=A0A2P2R558_RHIMU
MAMPDLHWCKKKYALCQKVSKHIDSCIRLSTSGLSKNCSFRPKLFPALSTQTQCRFTQEASL